MWKARVVFLVSILAALSGCAGVVSLHLLALPEMDSDWLIKEIKTLGQPCHEVVGGGDTLWVILTASPAELRRYLLPYVAEARLFDEETELERIH